MTLEELKASRPDWADIAGVTDGRSIRFNESVNQFFDDIIRMLEDHETRITDLEP